MSFLEFEHLSTLGSQESVVTIELIHILDRVRVLTVFEKKLKVVNIYVYLTTKNKYENKKENIKTQSKTFHVSLVIEMPSTFKIRFLLTLAYILAWYMAQW